MTYPRKLLVSLRATPYYHVVARCVRRAWLCGRDSYSGKDYTHRKRWVVHRLKQLSSIFAVDLCAYAVMSDHYHLVIHVDARRAAQWTTEEVVARWSRIFGRPEIIDRWHKHQCTAAESEAALRLVEQWRQRLHDVSWYMRALNEYLARRANAEDECTGRFWEGRFKSQALLDEAGLLTAMTYVDLNPIRAGAATTPESSDFTSIQARIAALKSQNRQFSASTGAVRGVPLASFLGERSSMKAVIPFSLKEYLDLVDWSGRGRRPDKRGAIDRRLPAIVTRLGINPERWLMLATRESSRFGRAIGSAQRLREYARLLGQSWVLGLRQAMSLYRPG